MEFMVVVHLCNAAKRKDAGLGAWFAGAHAAAVRRLRGFKAVQRFELAEIQILDIWAQPWRYMTLYEFETSAPDLDIPALAPLLDDAREKGLAARNGTERIHTYAMYHPWKYSANFKPGPLTHIMMLLANCVPGQEADYHKWYDEVHSVEVLNLRAMFGMRRGELAAAQVPPQNHHRAGNLSWAGCKQPTSPSP